MTFGALLETALTGTPERSLLRRASYEGLRRLAGRPLDPVDGVLVAEPCAPETRKAISPAAGARVLKILADRPALLPEWLAMVADGNWRLSHDCLPDLLEYVRGRPAMHDLLLQVGGERLFWLATLNPDWHFAARVDAEAQFASGTLDERVRALRRIRRQDPAHGRALLQDVLSTRSERAEARSALLEALAEGLSADDEPLLREAVRDSRKELREKGLRLIRRLPRSQFGQRWVERARQLLIIDTSVEVREPGLPEPAWIDDGLDPRPPRGIGTTAWILQQVVALTPPAIWAHGTLDAIQSSDWSQPLLAGLAQAAVTYADTDWCEELLLAESDVVRRAVHADALLDALTASRAETVVCHLLTAEAKSASTLAARLKHPWSQHLSRTALVSLPGLLTKWQYTASPLLQEAALRLDLSELPAAEAVLENFTRPAWARPAVERLVTTLEFRLAMRKELESPGSQGQ